MGIFDTLSRLGLNLPKGTGTGPAAFKESPEGGSSLLSGLQSAVAGPGALDRWGMLGATLQDIGDGGGRARTMQADRQAQTSADEAARQRQELNRLAQSIEMTPAQRLMFQADPERWASMQAEAEAPYTIGRQRVRNGEVEFTGQSDPQFFNTQRGIYKAEGDEFNPMVEFEPDPLEQELLRARIESERAQAGQRQAQAARARRPASSGGGSRQPAPSVNPRAVRWD